MTAETTVVEAAPTSPTLRSATEISASAPRRPPTTIPESLENTSFANRPIATPRHLRRGRRNNVNNSNIDAGLDSTDLNASPITPWDTLFSPNTQYVETTVSGTPIKSRLMESLSPADINITPALDRKHPSNFLQDGSLTMPLRSEEESSSMTTFIKQPPGAVLGDEVVEETRYDDVEKNNDIHPGDRVLNDDDIESFFSKRESHIRDRRATEKQPRRLSDHSGLHDMQYSPTPTNASTTTPEAFTTPQFRVAPPSSDLQPPKRIPKKNAGEANHFSLSMMDHKKDPDTPIGRNHRDQSDEPSSLWTNAARRAMRDLKRHVYQGQADDDDDGDPGTSSSHRDNTRNIEIVPSTMHADVTTTITAMTSLRTNRILPPSLSRRAPTPENDPFLETPRPSGHGRARNEFFSQTALGFRRQRDLEIDTVLDDTDVEQGFNRNDVADTAFISDGHDSITDLKYGGEGSREGQRRKRRRGSKTSNVHANRSFELGIKATREETEAEAAEAVEEITATVKEAEAKEESEDMVLRRQLKAEIDMDLKNYEESNFQEHAESTLHLPSAATLLNELLQERIGRQLTTPEELERRSWMYEE
ncbi:hypothetical protein FBU30_008472 [Linnemannia zychae]|nr:hypothetical protein FBU30_008472 [Linnemannia zychae]